MRRTILGFFLAAATAVACVACSSATGASLDPAKSNCNTVCEQAHMCLTSSLDVDSCTDSCDNKSSYDTYKSEVSACADCVADKTCNDSASCIGNCLSTVTNF
jgi:hypothetical protein